MTTGEIVTLFGVCISLVFGYIAMQRATKKDTLENGSDTQRMKSDIGYIKNAVDDIRADMRSMRADMTNLTKDLAKVEQIARSAQRRIDEHLAREHSIKLDGRDE